MAIVVSSLTAAQGCSCQINWQSKRIHEAHMRDKLCKEFKRIANCARRASAKLRRTLTATVMPIIQQKPVDLEAIEAMFDATFEVFTSYYREEPAKTALAIMSFQPAGGQRRLTITSDFLALSMKDQFRSEKALTAIGKASKKNKRKTAVDIFSALADSLQNNRPKLNSQIHTLIEDYVAEVELAWRSAGIRFGRAYRQDDPNYRSKFHRFTDLVLTEFVEPAARRHDDNLDEIYNKARQAHEKLPPKRRLNVTPARRRADVEWLVSPNHITKALQRIQKSD